MKIPLLILLCIPVFLFSQQETHIEKIDGKEVLVNSATGEVIDQDYNSSGTSAIDQSGYSHFYDKNDPNAGRYVSIYKIKSDDTFATIAQRNNMTLSDLLGLNYLKESDRLPVGTSIYVYSDSEYIVNKSEIDEYSKDEVLPNAEEVREEVVNPVETESTMTYHVVKKDDTLFSLAKRYGTTVEELQRLNNLNGNLIILNQRLVVR